MAFSAWTVRQRIAASIAGLATQMIPPPIPFRESPFTGENFPGDPTTQGHLCFCVDLPQTTLSGTDASPKRRPEGMWVSEEVRIRYLYQLPVDGQVEGYDDALETEEELRQAVFGTSQAGGLHIELSACRRESYFSEWLLFTHTYFARYLLTP